MIDAEIKKALGCCSRSKWGDKCAECFYLECDSEKGCRQELCEDALDLINRQQAEIEALKTNIVNVKLTDEQLKAQEQEANLLNYIKTEAIKEFAERLEAVGKQEGAYDYVSLWDIDNLVKEMVGDAE